MSLAELLCALVATAPGVVVFVLVRRRARRDEPEPVARPPFPLRAGVLAALAAVLGGAAGGVIGAMLLEPILETVLAHGTELAMTSPAELLVARLRLALSAGLGLALPGTAALVALVLSRDRSPRGAAVLAGATGIGVALGGALGAVVAPRGLHALLGASGGWGYIALVDVVAMLANALLGFGLAGALASGVAVAAARSAGAFRAALALTVIVPGATLFVAGLLSPPDVVSQLMLAVVFGAAWASGLVVAGIVRGVRSRAVR